MAYSFPGEGALDYFPCRYGTSRLLFRGPRRSLERPYVVFLGGTETYGKYVPNPFPDLVEDEIGFGAVNLACVNAGLDVFLNDDAVLDIARRAEAVVVQVLGAANLTNRYYTVHPRRNDRFIGATPLLKSLYRDVDFTEINFTRHLLRTLQATSAERFEAVADELRNVWMRRMTELLATLPERTVLLWMADHSVALPDRRADLSRHPILVDADMMATIQPRALRMVTAVTPPTVGMLGLDGMAFPALEAPAAAALPGPTAHREAAKRVAQALEGVLA